MTCVILLRTILSGVQLYPAINWVTRKCNMFWANKAKKGKGQLQWKVQLQITDHLSKLVPYFFPELLLDGISGVVVDFSDTKILMTWYNQDIKPPNKVLLQSISNKETDILQADLIKKKTNPRKCSLNRTKHYENVAPMVSKCEDPYPTTLQIKTGLLFSEWKTIPKCLSLHLFQVICFT